MLVGKAMGNSLLHFAGEALRRLESGNVVLGNLNGDVLADIASGLLSALFEDEATEATEIDVLASNHVILYSAHEGLYNGEYGGAFNASLFGNFFYDFCFCHCIKF